MGYRWITLIRMTPLNGAAETVNLTTGFSIGGSATTALTGTELRYEPITAESETINHELRPSLFGSRPEIALKFEIRDMSHYRVVARILSRLLDPSWKVELSLDNGTTYREVVLADAPKLKPWKGKTVAGMTVTFSVKCRKLIAELPYIESGTAW